MRNVAAARTRFCTCMGVVKDTTVINVAKSTEGVAKNNSNNEENENR